MEQIKWLFIAIFAGIQIISNIYTLLEAFKRGKINVYSYVSFRFFGEKPIREHSLAFEPTYFWLEVLYNLFWPAVSPFVVYILFFR